MIILGLVLLVAGYLFGIGILTTIGIIALVAGIALYVLGSVAHRPVGGRAHYW